MSGQEILTTLLLDGPQGSQVMPGRNGVALPFGWFTASNWDAPGEYKQEFGDQNYDYGVLVIDEALGNTVDWFGFEIFVGRCSV